MPGIYLCLKYKGFYKSRYCDGKKYIEGSYKKSIHMAILIEKELNDRNFKTKIEKINYNENSCNLIIFLLN